MERLSKIVISSLFIYSRVKIYFYDVLRRWYITNSYIRKIWNISDHLLKYSGYLLQKYIYQVNCEPVCPVWSHAFIIVDDDPKHILEYKEKYEMIPKLDENGPMMVSFPIIHPFLLFTTRNSLKMVKYTVENGDIYYVSLISQKNINMVDLTILEPSIVSFLTVEYTHPGMDESISIDIPKGMYINGNEILNPAFVYRALLYQSKDFIFDEDYVVKIMDHDINMFEVKYHEYVRILPETYRVIGEKPIAERIKDIIDPTPIETKEWDQWE
jgi:hypothetical protein